MFAMISGVVSRNPLKTIDRVVVLEKSVVPNYFS